MQSRSSADNKSASSKAANKSAPLMTDKENAEKKRLQKDIQELRSIIKKAEWSLETLRFKDAESGIKSQDLKISHFNRTTNVEVQLQNDLYKFAGFRCVKFKRGEAIFNFMSADEQQKDNTYAVQIFVKDRKGSLGKWVMPMSIDMNKILTKIPIDELKNLTAFIKNCKHNINCYAVRQEQFLSLKKHIVHMKHCELYSNIGYMQFNLELYGVYDREDDKYIDLIIYLLYHSDEARPYKIKVDTTKNKLSDETSQRLKMCLKEFKISDIQTAFDKVFMKKNSAFMWTREGDDESPLEINDTSTSDEEDFLEQLQSERKKSLRKTKRRRELRNKIKWNKRKIQKSISRNIASSENNSNDDARSEVEEHTKSPHQTSINEKKTEAITSSSKQQKRNEKNLATPMNKSKIRLKQTKLNFQATQSTNSSNINKESSLQSKPYIKIGSKKQKVAQLVTSTPLHPRVRNKLISTLEIDNITEIGSPPKEAADNTNDLKNSSHSENVISTKKIQEDSQKLLRRSPRSSKSTLSTHILKDNKPVSRDMKK